MKWYEDPIYIKMSEKAVELQYLWNKVSPDLDTHDFGFIKDGKFITLFRQDQLQGMVGSFDVNDFDKGVGIYSCPKVMCEDILDFAINDCDMGITSMEQLWMAFVYKENYNKIWNGEDWINEQG